MLFKSICASALLPTLIRAQGLNTFNNVVVTPISEDDADRVDGATLFYAGSGDTYEVYFYGAEHQGETAGRPLRNTEGYGDGHFETRSRNSTNYVTINENNEMIVASADIDDGIWYVQDNVLFYNYAYPWLACQFNDTLYHLYWRGYGNATCDNDNWFNTALVIEISATDENAEGNEELEQLDFYPDPYETAVAATAVQYISGTGTEGATTLTSVGQPSTAVAATTTGGSSAEDSSSSTGASSSSSSAGAVKVGFGAGLMAGAALLML